MGLGTILIIILVLALLGAFGGNANWGYAPGGIIGVILVAVLIFVLLGRI